MRILLEEHEYEASKVKDVLWEGAFQNVDGYVAVKYVGYFYNPRIEDCVFILPKVLLEGDENDTRSERLFGQYAPEDVIDFEKAAIDDRHRKFLRDFSVWVYRAVNVYREQVRDDPQRSRQVLYRHAPSAGNGRRSRGENTLLDVILALLDFRRENEDFLTYTTRRLHSGANRIDWTRTVAKSPCFLDGDDGTPVYVSPVNRKKVVDFDEELFVIFYSILNYARTQFGFDADVRFGYKPIAGKAFERYRRGYGKRRLEEIRYKYYSDLALRLWELCHAFFDETARLGVAADRQEYLLAKNFYVVFEAMVDELVGDPREKLPDGLKDQADGKRVDHLYSYRDLTNDEQKDREIYYIGDSKYYKLTTQLGPEAVAKQFTYARNVVQWNLDLFLSGKSGKGCSRSYRDETTEGYNIVPNFFIGGNVDNETLSYADNLEEADKRAVVHVSKQFENRLFDRDTLLVAHYDLNFLFVLSLYARDKASDKAAWKETVRGRFRAKIQDLLRKRYEFYAMTPRGDVPTEGFLREHFQELLGKVYTPYDDEDASTLLGKHVYYSLALEKPLSEEDISKLKTAEERDRARKRNTEIPEENENVLAIAKLGFKIEKCDLGTNPSSVPGLSPESPASTPPAAVGTALPVYPRKTILDSWLLVGCIKDTKHRDWIFGRVPKWKRDSIYNVRLDKSRDGAMNRSELRGKRPRFVILYDLADSRQYWVYRVRNNAIIKCERMKKSGYPNPQGNYFCFILDEQVSLGPLDVQAMIARKQAETGDSQYASGAPFCVKGSDLLPATAKKAP